MIKQEYQYHLATPDEQKKHGGKWKCPNCGETKFVPFLDKLGAVVDVHKYGRCERINSCKYFKYPYSTDKQNTSRPTYKQTPPPKPTYIDDGIFRKSLKDYERNNLITFLNRVFDVGAVDKMIADYFIGTSHHWSGSTVFWQRDRFGRIHGGKIMQYNPDNGKRVKEPHNRITWVHTAFKIPKFNLRQCLFGEHLLAKHPDMFVGIVESEKTAIIASGVVTDCIFLACGGCQNLTIAMCEPLRGRNVVLFPDNSKLAEWSEKGRKLRHLFKTLSIVDIMESEEILQRYSLKAGDDIGDLILAQKFDIKDLEIELKEL